MYIYFYVFFYITGQVNEEVVIIRPFVLSIILLRYHMLLTCDSVVWPQVGPWFNADLRKRRSSAFARAAAAQSGTEQPWTF